eukprot:scaffold37112_cov35-Tisochrysis_lutea.AAC.3
MSIPDELAARMPLSYVHFTHFLVDSLLLLAPFALYPKTGAFSIFLTGMLDIPSALVAREDALPSAQRLVVITPTTDAIWIGVMTLFYRGLLELSKSFLDPFGNKRVSSKFMAADLEGAAKLPFVTGKTMQQPPRSDAEIQ